MRTCTKCELGKPATLEYFRRDKRGGLRSQCKECERQHERKKYHAQNAGRERVRISAPRLAGETIPNVSVEPLMHIIRLHAGAYGNCTFAKMCSINDRIVRRVLDGSQKQVSIDTADKILLYAGEWLREYYPELYDFPEYICERCETKTCVGDWHGRNWYCWDCSEATSQLQVLSQRD